MYKVRGPFSKAAFLVPFPRPLALKKKELKPFRVEIFFLLSYFGYDYSFSGVNGSFTFRFSNVKRTKS